MKLSFGKHSLAARADFVCVGITASGLNPHPVMEKRVISDVLTNHQWGGFGARTIRMVNDRAFWQRFTESLFCSDAMKACNRAVDGDLFVVFQRSHEHF